MEYIDLIVSLINTVGFPMVMVGYFIWDKNKTMDKLTATIENNNTILTKLLEKFDHLEEAVTHE